MFVNTSGLDRAEVLLALYLHAVRNEPDVEGDMGYSVRKPTLRHAQIAILENETLASESDRQPDYYFAEAFLDYMTVDLDVNLTDPNRFDPTLFDCKHGGSGTAQRLIDNLRTKLNKPIITSTQPPDSPVSKTAPSEARKGFATPILTQFRRSLTWSSRKDTDNSDGTVSPYSASFSPVASTEQSTVGSILYTPDSSRTQTPVPPSITLSSPSPRFSSLMNLFKV